MLRKRLDSSPYAVLIPVSLVLGLAPFRPEPHLVEKLRLLFLGRLERAIDLFDLLLHAAPLILLCLKFGMQCRPGRTEPGSQP